MKTDVYEEKVATSKSSSQRGEEKFGSSKPELDKEEMMKKALAAGTPGAAHKALDAFTGNWKAEVKCFMDADGPANVTQGTAKVSWILGGRYLEEEFHGEMMGKPFNGRWLLGFNNTKQKYQSVWVDDFGTAMITSEGKGESGNKVITLEGKTDCAGTGQKDIAMKQVFRILSADKHVVEMSHDGRKSMEITYTRQ